MLLCLGLWLLSVGQLLLMICLFLILKKQCHLLSSIHITCQRDGVVKKTQTWLDWNLKPFFRWVFAALFSLKISHFVIIILKIFPLLHAHPSCYLSSYSIRCPCKIDLLVWGFSLTEGLGWWVDFVFPLSAPFFLSETYFRYFSISKSTV